MPGQTPNFGYSYFDWGDTLDDPLNVQLEVQRFTLIDRQLYGLSSIFGDGVVSGWDITDTGNLTIAISAGAGLYAAAAIESTLPSTISDLTPNSFNYVYAVPQPGTSGVGIVNFIASQVEIANGLLIGTVQTNSTDVQTIDPTVRTNVGFVQVIQNIIATTRHDGAAHKIDLTQEVQGQLPMSNMADIDASKVVGGRLPTSVLPTIDHSQLKNIGVLTHPQLDSIVQSIQNDNIALLGEVASVNLMKMIAYMKYLDIDVDKYFVNELCIIPGVTPDSYIDYENSNAIIDRDSNCISGIPELPIDFTNLVQGGDGTNPPTGTNFELITVEWNTDSEFQNEAVSLTNVAIANGVHLSVDTIYDRIIEDFEGVVGQNVPDFTANLTESNVTHVVYDSTAAQGDTSGRFETINSRTAQFTLTLPSVQDWSSYDKFIVFIKNFSTTHAGATINFLDNTGATIGSYILLLPDEITGDDPANVNGFSQKTFDISTFTRTTVQSITITTTTLTTEQEAFYVDTMFLRTTQYLLPQGNIRLRKSTTAPVIYNSVDFAATIPAGTDLQVRVRVASTLEDLPNTTFSSLLQSGESFSLTGRVCEIDITLLSSADKTQTPNLTDVILNILAPSEISGLSIASATAWQQGTDLVNIQISGQDPNAVVEMQYTNVGNFYFINASQVSELDPNNAPFVGINSQYMPIAPIQGENLINPPTSEYDAYGGIERTDTIGLYNPLSVYRLESGNYMIADTYNDRVMEMEPDGTFVRGWGSHNYDTNENSLYALTSCYNPRLGVLFITLSQPTDVASFDLTNISLVVGDTTVLQLSNENDQVRTLDGNIVTDRTPGATANNPPSNLTGEVERTLSVFLSADKQAILNSTISAVYTTISNNIQDRIACFIGDFTYFGSFGIHRPIYANMSNDTDVIVANASILSEFSTVVQLVPIIEFNIEVGQIIAGQSTPLGLTYSLPTQSQITAGAVNPILFSDMMLGSLQVLQSYTDAGALTRKLLVAGVIYNQGAGQGSSSSGGGAANVFSVALSPLDDKKMLLFNGIVQLIDMNSGLVQFQYQCSDGHYPSDAYIDGNGNVVVAESTFTAQAGRIITLDINGIGDGGTPPIINLIEGGVYTKIWDIRPLDNNQIFVST